MSDFSLPRTPLPAHLLQTQGVSRPGVVYVMERVADHDGPETVLEMLNRPEGFFAFRPADEGDVLLVSKAHTMWLSQDRQAPIADPARLSAAGCSAPSSPWLAVRLSAGGPASSFPRPTPGCSIT